MDSLSTQLMNQAFVMGFDYGKTWFIIYLLVVLGIFIYKLIGRL